MILLNVALGVAAFDRFARKRRLRSLKNQEETKRRKTHEKGRANYRKAAWRACPTS